ncbi:MAG: hypothetical protein HY905_00780 [Deltaproteobacteria bacterium]|nr:hypothetical protein [Deltaproteobacteria bacterium]
MLGLVGAFAAAVSCWSDNPPPPADDETGSGQFALGGGCRTDVSIADLSVTPSTITPADGNGIFDVAELAFAVEIAPGRGACVLESRRFNFFASWSASVLSSGVSVRRFEGREYLDFEGCTADAISIPVQLEWRGEGDDGASLPAGAYEVEARGQVEMQVRPEGRPVVVRRSRVVTVPIAVATEPSAAEIRLDRVAEIKAGLSIGDPSDPDAGPYDAVRVPRATLDELADIRYALAGRTLEEEFVRQEAVVAANEEVAVKPDASQIEAWRSAFELSHGRLSVEWSALGVPANLTGLNDDPVAGTDVEVATAWLAEFGNVVGPLFRAGAVADGPSAGALRTLDGAGALGLGSTLAGDALVLADVVPEETGSAVTFNRVVVADGGAGKVVYPVLGDFVTLFVLKSGVADGKLVARVFRLRARWSPALPQLTPSISAAKANELALDAAGIADGEVIAPARTPFLYGTGWGRARLLYEVRVRNPYGTELRVLWIDAVAGEVYWDRDGNQRARSIEFAADPMRRSWRPAGVSWKPMPYTNVYSEDADLSAPPGPTRPKALCVTDGAGRIPSTCAIAPGTMLRVALRGPFFEQWTPQERLGDINADPLWRSLPFEYVPGAGPIRVSPDPAYVPWYYNAEEEANIYHLFHYLRGLYESYFLDTWARGPGGPPTYFRTYAAPHGLHAQCSVDEHCWTCARRAGTPPGTCDGRNFGYPPTDRESLCSSGPGGDAYCGTQYGAHYCQFHAPMDATGTCAKDTCGSGVTEPSAALWGQYASPETVDVREIDIDACVRHDDAWNPVEYNWGLMRIVFHEFSHMVHGNNEGSRAPPGNYFGWAISEDRGKVDVPVNTVSIEDRIRACSLNVGATFGGNPLAGVDEDGLATCAASPEDDDPEDSYFCDSTLPETCVLGGTRHDPIRKCHHRDSSGFVAPVPVPEGMDWFEGIMERLVVQAGRSGAFREHVNVLRVGLAPTTRVSSTTDSLYRFMTDGSFANKYAFEIWRAFNPVVRQGRRGIYLDALDDRTSTRGRGEVRSAFEFPSMATRGRIDHGWDSDWFVLRASANVRDRTYRIRVLPDDPLATDTVLEVWRFDASDGGWRRIARNDGVLGDEVYVTLNETPDAVPLFIRVVPPWAVTIESWLWPYRVDASRIGGYQLVAYPSVDDYPDPSWGSAAAIAPHQGRAQGRVVTGDRDGFAVDVPAGVRLLVTVKTPGLTTSGVRVFRRRQGETSEVEVPRSPLVPAGLGACGPECFETEIADAAGRYFFAVDGADLSPGTTAPYVVWTETRGTIPRDRCPAGDSDTSADWSCRISDLDAGEWTERAGVLLDSSDRDYYWVQARKGDLIGVTAVGYPGGRRDAVTLSLRAEDATGTLCADGTDTFDGHSEVRSPDIAESAVAADGRHRSAGEMTFVVPADRVGGGYEIGWYRIAVTPVPGIAAYPQHYSLVVQHGVEDDVFPDP